MGVSHQKVGRWLREGEKAVIDPYSGLVLKQAGAKSIPAEYSQQIDFVFNIHKGITREQAKADKLPFNPEAPAFAARGIMKNGKKGDRVIVENTQYIKPDLRIKVLEDAQKSKQYLQASVRSKINKRDYAKRAAENEIKNGRRFETVKSLAKKILASIEGTRRIKTIDAVEETMPLFTRYENISAGTRPGAIKAIEKKLNEKHAPSAQELADEFLFQVDNRRQPIAKPKAGKAVKPRSRKK